jgi:hypothetical protein
MHGCGSKSVLISLQNENAGYDTTLSQIPTCLPEEEFIGPIDYERLVAIFMEPDRAMPPDLIHSASLVQELGNDEAMDALLNDSRVRTIVEDLGDDPNPYDVALRVYLEDQELLQELHQMHQLDRPRSFTHFVTDRNPIPPFREPTDNQITALEAELAEWFRKHKRGRYARVWNYPRPDAVWFLVRHGLPNKRQEVLSEAGSGTLHFRPGEYDVLEYSETNGELAVHGCNPAEVKFLKEAFGKHFFGDPAFFPGDAKYTYTPLLAGEACLAVRGIGDIKSVTLVEVQHSIRRNRLRKTYRSDDLFDSIKAGDVVMPPADQIVGASLLVRFSDSAKQRTVKIIGSNKLSVVHDSDKALMEEWLDVSGFVIHRPGNEDETEVLASA